MKWDVLYLSQLLVSSNDITRSHIISYVLQFYIIEKLFYLVELPTFTNFWFGQLDDVYPSYMKRKNKKGKWKKSRILPISSGFCQITQANPWQVLNNLIPVFQDDCNDRCTMNGWVWKHRPDHKFNLALNPACHIRRLANL